MKKMTTSGLRAMKNKQNIACLTAYDFFSARWCDEAGIPLILVGDSLGMTVLGYGSTLPVTMEDMLHHTKAVSRGVAHALVVADMPFMSYHASVEEGVRNAGRFLQEAGADAVKIEGGADQAGFIHALVGAGIPVLGHVGLLPQRVKTMGGYKVQARASDAQNALLEDVKALEEAGVFALVLEGVPREVGAMVTNAAGVPVIGIGAGVECDGQVLVLHDALGMFDAFSPRFARAFAQVGEAAQQGILAYKEAVESGTFPSLEESY